jgi:hypothetical protein
MHASSVALGGHGVGIFYGASLVSHRAQSECTSSARTMSCYKYEYDILGLLNVPAGVVLASSSYIIQVRDCELL